MKENDGLNRVLLERTARTRQDAPAPGVCLDAETLAAWTDGSLTSAERASAERHAADCERCLDVLAAIARTTPPAAPAEHPGWWSVRWLVPLTTAVLVLGVWVLIPSAPSGPAEPAAPASVDLLKPVDPAAIPERDSASDTQTDAASRQTGSPQKSRELADQVESRRSVFQSGSAAKEERRAASGERRAAEQEARPASPPAAAAPPPAQEPARTRARDEALAQFRSAVTPSLVVSPDPSHRWRIVGSTVERSIDGGLTWQTQPTGTSAELLAGSSPAADVVWIVGRAGTVLLSTDGKTWQRLAFPVKTADPDALASPRPADVVAVTARDAADATVTTADGRSYRTTDAGRTWVLQEHLTPSF